MRNPKTKLYSHLPYAHYAYKRIHQFAKKHKPKRVLDIASAQFINRFMFGEDVLYIGADIKQNSLQKSLARYQGKNIAVQSNIANLPPLKNIVDMVVCSFTLIYLPPRPVVGVIQKLSDMVSPGGHLLIESPKRINVDRIRQMLLTEYDTVSVTYFHSHINKKTMYLFHKLGLMMSRVPLYPLLIKSWATCTESFYPNMRWSNHNVFLIAENKKEKDKKINAKNDFSAFAKIGPRLYHDGQCPTVDKIYYQKNKEELQELIIQYLKSYNALGSVLLIHHSDDRMETYAALTTFLDARNVSWASGSLRSEHKPADLVIYLNYIKSEVPYLHYNLYKYAKRKIIITAKENIKNKIERIL